MNKTIDNMQTEIEWLTNEQFHIMLAVRTPAVTLIEVQMAFKTVLTKRYIMEKDLMKNDIKSYQPISL